MATEAIADDGVFGELGAGDDGKTTVTDGIGMNNGGEMGKAMRLAVSFGGEKVLASEAMGFGEHEVIIPSDACGRRGGDV